MWFLLLSSLFFKPGSRRTPFTGFWVWYALTTVLSGQLGPGQLNALWKLSTPSRIPSRASFTSKGKEPADNADFVHQSCQSFMSTESAVTRQCFMHDTDSMCEYVPSILTQNYGHVRLVMQPFRNLRTCSSALPSKNNLWQQPWSTLLALKCMLYMRQKDYLLALDDFYFIVCTAAAKSQRISWAKHCSELHECWVRKSRCCSSFQPAGSNSLCILFHSRIATERTPSRCLPLLNTAQHSLAPWEKIRSCDKWFTGEFVGKSDTCLPLVYHAYWIVHDQEMPDCLNDFHVVLLMWRQVQEGLCSWRKGSDTGGHCFLDDAIAGVAEHACAAERNSTFWEWLKQKGETRADVLYSAQRQAVASSIAYRFTGGGAGAKWFASRQSVIIQTI